MPDHDAVLEALQAWEQGGAKRRAGLKALSGHLGSKATRAHLLSFGERMAPPMAELVLHGKGRTKRGAAEVLVEVAEHVDAEAIEEAILYLLEEFDKEVLQRLGLHIVARVRRPTDALLEPSADLSALPEARKALSRFPFEQVKGELRSLLKSRSAEERAVGLQLVQHYGAAASEHTDLLAGLLKTDTHETTARLTVHALARLVPDEELAEALEPALDHWSEEVQRVAGRYLKQADAPVRDSKWDGHPFSTGLRQMLQKFGFEPAAAFDIPAQRPLPRVAYAWGEQQDEDIAAQLSPAAWAWMNALKFPPYKLYTVWGSYEDSATFHFSDEGKIFPETIDGRRHLMWVIGDGSIGYFATIDLMDQSNDPVVYFIERWGGDWQGSAWRVNRTLSSFLRTLGSRF